jgi:hypothetical protein
MFAVTAKRRMTVEVSETILSLPDEYQLNRDHRLFFHSKVCRPSSSGEIDEWIQVSFTHKSSRGIIRGFVRCTIEFLGCLDIDNDAFNSLKTSIDEEGK